MFHSSAAYTVHDDPRLTFVRSLHFLIDEGFAYLNDTEGNLLYFPQLQGLIIEINVSIGANTVISVGSLQHKQVGLQSKINGNALIGHGVKIGSNVQFNAGAVASGECEILDHSWIGTNATILQRVEVREGCTVGSGAVVTKDCLAGATYIGVPARKLGV